MKDLEQQTKLCAIYGRTALSNPAALDAQITTCRAKAHNNAWICDQRYIFGDDGVSGNSRLCDRRGLSALFASLANGVDHVDYLLVTDIDRLSRHGFEALAIVDALTRIRVTVYVVGSALDMSLPASRKLVALHQTLAQHELGSQGARLLVPTRPITKWP